MFSGRRVREYLCLFRTTGEGVFVCFQDGVAAGADRVRECLCVFGMTGAGAFVCFQDDG